MLHDRRSGGFAVVPPSTLATALAHFLHRCVELWNARMRRHQGLPSPVTASAEGKYSPRQAEQTKSKRKKESTITRSVRCSAACSLLVGALGP